MQDNGTVQQLSKALNQLLDAYEKLQEESVIIKEENTLLKEENEDLELQNRGLENKLNTLNDTTKHNSSEMDTMLGRIENILGSSASEEKELLEEDFVEETIEESIKEELELLEKEDIAPYPNNINQEDNKEIDLGRMQSLLNGFSN